MGTKTHWGEWLAVAGLVIVFAATALPLFHVENAIYRWIYGGGALAVTLGKAIRPVLSDNIRVKRLSRIEVWGGVMFLAATFFMFYYPQENNDWIAFTLAGGVIEVYASLMIARQLGKKEG